MIPDYMSFSFALERSIEPIFSNAQTLFGMNEKTLREMFSSEYHKY